MTLSPFVSFQSRFVTYLLTFPHIMGVGENGSMQPIPPPLLFACYRYC